MRGHSHISFSFNTVMHVLFEDSVFINNGLFEPHAAEWPLQVCLSMFALGHMQRLVSTMVNMVPRRDTAHLGKLNYRDVE